MANVKTIGVGNGVSISDQTGYLEAHAALSEGDSIVVSFAAFDSTSGLPYLTKAPATAQQEYDVVAIAAQDLAAGATGKFYFSGVVLSNVDSGVAAGEILAVTNAAFDLQDATAVTNTKIVGRALEAYSASALSKVWFDGLNGLGHNET